MRSGASLGFFLSPGGPPVLWWLPLSILLAPPAAAPDGAVTYAGRTIDVRVFIEKGESERLLEADFRAGAVVDFARARRLSEVDFSKRNFWGAVVSHATG